MITEQQMVRDFMIKAGQECPTKPTIPSNSICDLRIELISEELGEYCESVRDGKFNLCSVADAIGDLLVVVIGTAVAHGIDIQAVFAEINRSNMTKFIDGYKREDGKWIKGPSYSPANLEPIIQKQLES